MRTLYHCKCGNVFGIPLGTVVACVKCGKRYEAFIVVEERPVLGLTEDRVKR